MDTRFAAILRHPIFKALALWNRHINCVTDAILCTVIGAVSFVTSQTRPSRDAETFMVARVTLSIVGTVIGCAWTTSELAQRPTPARVTITCSAINTMSMVGTLAVAASAKVTGITLTEAAIAGVLCTVNT